MAQKTILIDDIDGTEAHDTYEFGYNGVSYQIDLSEKNAELLRKDIEKWTAKARRKPGGNVRRPAAGKPRKVSGKKSSANKSDDVIQGQNDPQENNQNDNTQSYGEPQNEISGDSWNS